MFPFFAVLAFLYVFPRFLFIEDVLIILATGVAMQQFFIRFYRVVIPTEINKINDCYCCYEYNTLSYLRFFTLTNSIIFMLLIM